MIILICETAVYQFTVHLQPLQSPKRLKEWTVNTVNELFVTLKENDVDIQLVANRIYSIYSIYSFSGDSWLVKTNFIMDRQLID
jgi:hypothetical protein